MSNIADAIRGYIEVEAKQLAIENRGKSTIIAELTPDQRDWLAGMLAGFAERMVTDAQAFAGTKA